MSTSLKNCYPLVKKDMKIQEYKKDERGQFYIISILEKHRYIKTHEFGLKFLELIDGSRSLEEIYRLLNEGTYKIDKESFIKLVEYFSIKEVISKTGKYSYKNLKENPNDFFIFNHVILEDITKFAGYSFLQRNTRKMFTKHFGFLLLILNIIGFFASISIYTHSTELQLLINNEIDSILSLLLIFSILSITIVLHELGHALACSKYGGTPKEVGIALLLFIPAMYIQTRGTWNLRDKDAVKIYLAGPIVSFTLAASAGITYFLIDNPLLRSIMILTVIINQGAMILTLYPFIPNDGYFALERALSFPNLIRNSIKIWITFIKKIVNFMLPKENKKLIGANLSLKKWSRKEILISLLFGPFYFISLSIFIVPILLFSWITVLSFIIHVIEGNYQDFLEKLSKNSGDMISLLTSFLFQIVIFRKALTKKGKSGLKHE